MRPAPFDDKKPDFINEQGVKWWADKDETHYARHKLGTDAVVWYVEETDGRRTRLLTENNEILHECQTIDGMASYVDILAIARKPE